MPISVTCACGKEYSLPDAYGGKKVRCKTCDAVIEVPEPVPVPVAENSLPPPPPKKAAQTPAARVVVLVALVAGIAGGYFATRRTTKYQPTNRESVVEKYRSASREFAGQPVETTDAGAEEAGIRSAVDALVGAMGSNNGKKFVDSMHLPRLLAEIEANGAIPGLDTRREEEQALEGLRQGLTSLPSQAAAGPLRWEKSKIIRIRLIPGRKEATAFTLLWQSGIKSKFRFWLIQEEGVWKIFDWDSLEEGIRVSTLFAQGIQFAIQKKGAFSLPEMQRLTQQIQQATLQITSQDLEKGLETIGKVRKGKVPPFLLSQIDLLEGSALMGLGRSEEALKIFDQALARQRDLPVVHYLRATTLLSLGRNEEAVKAAGEYLKMLGDDADVHHAIGQAHEAMEKPEEAIQSYRNGAECDEEDCENRYSLALLLLSKGETEEPRKLAEQIRPREGWGPPAEYVVAHALALEGKAEESLQRLEKVLQERPDFLEGVETSPAFEKVRALPAWQERVKKMKEEMEEDE